MKLTFTRDGEKDIPVIRGSLYNVVVTNTEKIRIQKETVRKGDLGGLLRPKGGRIEARAEVANLRLQAIASLAAPRRSSRTRRTTPTDSPSTPNSRRSGRPSTTSRRTRTSSPS